MFAPVTKNCSEMYSNPPINSCIPLEYFFKTRNVHKNVVDDTQYETTFKADSDVSSENGARR